MNFRTNDEKLEKMYRLQKLVNPNFAQVIISESDDGVGMDIDIRVSSDRFCSVFCSVSPDVFDICLDNIISTSDVSHNDFDFFEIICSVISGNVSIYKLRFFNHNIADRAEVFLNGKDKFFLNETKCIGFLFRHKKIQCNFESYLI